MSFIVKLKKKLEAIISSPFVIGMGSAFNLSGNYYPKRKILSEKEAWEADQKALRGDWEAVGKDVGNAIHKFEETYNVKQRRTKKDFRRK